MTETGRDVVERLRAQVGPEKFNCFLPVYIEDIRALLAVVEAAQEYREIQQRDPTSLDLPPAGSRLDYAIQRLHSQASDEGKS